MNTPLASPHRTESLHTGAPKLMVVVDTEEEFDWSKPVSRSEIKVSHIQYEHRAQSIFERFGLSPTYVVDYPVASQESAWGLLRAWRNDGRCQIGAHLHPWVNPPYEEEISARNSYPGNLPASLEREKLRRLTETIENNFGHRPTIYRAGRYGIGSNTPAILEDLGYEIDTSVVPFTDFRADEGPDFTASDAEPYWIGPSQSVLELPLTVAWYGLAQPFAKALQPFVMSQSATRLHVPGVLARLCLLERIRLTPEGTTFAELKRLTDTMIADGKRLFIFSYHSPSVVPGNTPYVRDASELSRFLGLIERYCEYFFGACAGIPTTPEALFASARNGAVAGGKRTV